MNKFWKQFKSGTDVRGVAVEGVEGQVYNLTDEVIEKITAGFLFWLSEKLRKPCAELTVAVDMIRVFLHSVLKRLSFAVFP